VNPNPPNFVVQWGVGADEGLAAAFVAYFPSRQGIRVTNAERIISLLLADDPIRNGVPLHEELYRVDISPLRAFYEVYPASRRVLVTEVGYFSV
jgi:hypothetical protein